MKKLFEKHETLFCILLIILYISSNSFCVQKFGNTSWVSFVINTVLSAFLVAIIIGLKRVSYYGLTRVENIKKYLYFIPLIPLVSVNLWSGININNSLSEIIRLQSASLAAE